MQLRNKILFYIYNKAGYYGPQCIGQVDQILTNRPNKNHLNSSDINFDLKTNFNDIFINPCSSNPCQNNGKCGYSATGYYCICDGSYTGKNCEVSPYASTFNPCFSTPCLNNGVCLTLGLTYTCSCGSKFTG
jgi:hypothetical protein